VTEQGLSTVSDFHADGLVSAEADRRYGDLPAVQQRYAPEGVDTGLCVGVARVVQGEDLTLQPCDDPTTVWIIHPAVGVDPGLFAIVNAATTDFDRPFAMHLPREEVVSGDPELQMQLRRLQYRTGDGRCRRGRSGAPCSDRRAEPVRTRSPRGIVHNGPRHPSVPGPVDPARRFEQRSTGNPGRDQLSGPTARLRGTTPV
jgi:hypothetical protein